MKTGLDGLTIAPVPLAERDVLENVYQLYLHDFSEYYAETSLLELNDKGLFVEKPPLDRWWTTIGHVPLLLRWQGHPAGFALVDDDSEIDEPVDHAIAEFFVVRKYRRIGLGIAAAHAVCNNWPGTWEAAVIRKNASARAFWDKALRLHTGVDNLVSQDRRDDLWDGTVFRFDIAAS